MKRERTRCLVALAGLGWLLVAPPAAVAQQPVHEERPAAADLRLDVESVLVGQVRIVGWERELVQVDGTIGEDVELALEGSQEALSLSFPTRDGRGRRHDARVDLELHVPHGTRLELTGVTADVHVEGLDGAAEIELVTGEVTFAGAAPEIQVVTVTGKVQIRAAAVRRARVETTVGDVSFDGALAPDGELRIETTSGSVTATLPADTAAEFDLETLLGRIDSDFGGAVRRERFPLHSEELTFRTGDGGARVSIATLQGTIRLRAR